MQGSPGLGRPLKVPNVSTEIVIPEEFRGWRFILVGRQSKKAFEKDWQTTANYEFDDQKLRDHLAQRGNYGILGGVIVETDTPDLERLVEQAFPPTLTQRSPGHHSKHFFYVGTLSKTIPLFDRTLPKNKASIGHVKNHTSYVLGPTSVHPNGGRYELVDKRPAAPAPSEDQLVEVLGGFMAKRAAKAERAEAGKYRRTDFDITDLVAEIPGLKEHSGQLQGPHPVHGSETGTNFSVNPAENVWHCFRCNSGGGPWSLLAVMERIIDCEDAVPGGLRGDRFKMTMSSAQKRGLIQDEEPPKGASRIETVTEVFKRRLLSLADEEGKIATRDAAKVAADVAVEYLGPFLSMQDTEEVLHYNGGVFHEGGDGVIAKTVEEWFQDVGAGSLCTNQLVTEALGHVKRRTSTEREVFDGDPFILNCQNGLLDLRTFEFKPHTDKYASLVQLPVSYDQQADCPRIKKFISEVLYREDVNTIQEIVGSTLWRQPLQKAGLLWGEGSNGKSTLLSVIARLLGRENVASRSLQDLVANRFAAADLYGKLANIFADLPDEALKSTGWFKMLTGGDSVSAEHKFQHAFQFINYAKLLFSCNKVPEVPRDDSDAFFRRWLIVTFPYSFFGDKDDKNLLQELTTEDELSGFLNWAIEGLRRLQANRWNFSDSKSVEQVRVEYIRKSSPIRAFVMDCCIQDPNAQIPKQALFDGFVEYCKEHKLPVVTSDTFFKRLPEHVKVETARVEVAGKRPMCFIGISLKDKPDWGKNDEQETLD